MLTNDAAVEALLAAWQQNGGLEGELIGRADDAHARAALDEAWKANDLIAYQAALLSYDGLPLSDRQPVSVYVSQNQESGKTKLTFHTASWTLDDDPPPWVRHVGLRLYSPGGGESALWTTELPGVKLPVRKGDTIMLDGLR